MADLLGDYKGKQFFGDSAGLETIGALAAADNARPELPAPVAVPIKATQGADPWAGTPWAGVGGSGGNNQRTRNQRPM